MGDVAFGRKTGKIWGFSWWRDMEMSLVLGIVGLEMPPEDVQ